MHACHNIVQSSFLSTFPSWSWFSISFIRVWKISCTLCVKKKKEKKKHKVKYITVITYRYLNPQAIDMYPLFQWILPSNLHEMLTSVTLSLHYYWEICLHYFVSPFVSYWLSYSEIRQNKTWTNGKKLYIMAWRVVSKWLLSKCQLLGNRNRMCPSSLTLFSLADDSKNAAFQESASDFPVL